MSEQDRYWQLLRAGDEEALSYLFRLYHQALCQYAVRMLKYPSVAQNIAQVSWTISKWRLNLQNARFGAVTSHHPNDRPHEYWIVNSFTQTLTSWDQTFRVKGITDLTILWRVNDHFHCSFHARNIFNIYPDHQQQRANTNNGVFQYRRYGQQFGGWGTYLPYKLLV